MVPVLVILNIRPVHIFWAGVTKKCIRPLLMIKRAQLRHILATAGLVICIAEPLQALVLSIFLSYLARGLFSPLTCSMNALSFGSTCDRFG